MEWFIFALAVFALAVASDAEKKVRALRFAMKQAKARIEACETQISELKGK